MTLTSQSCVGCGAPLKSNVCDYCGRVYKEDSKQPVAPAPVVISRKEHLFLHEYMTPFESRKSSKIPIMEAGVTAYSWLYRLRDHKGRLAED